MKSILAGIVLSAASFGAAAAEDFGTLNGIPAEAMNAAEMQSVEGKGLLDLGLQTSAALGAEVGLNVLGLVDLGVGLGLSTGIGVSVGVMN